MKNFFEEIIIMTSSAGQVLLSSSSMLRSSRGIRSRRRGIRTVFIVCVAAISTHSLHFTTCAVSQKKYTVKTIDFYASLYSGGDVWAQSLSKKVLLPIYFFLRRLYEL